MACNPAVSERGQLLSGGWAEPWIVRASLSCVALNKRPARSARRLMREACSGFSGWRKKAGLSRSMCSSRSSFCSRLRVSACACRHRPRIGRRAHLVFVTAFDAYAVEAFTQGAVDHLVKPLERARLAETVLRLQERLAGSERDRGPDLGAVLEQLALRLGGTPPERLRWIHARRRCPSAARTSTSSSRCDVDPALVAAAGACLNGPVEMAIPVVGSTDVTRTAPPGLAPRARSRLLAPGQVVASPESGLRYRVESLVGEGGFGQVYLAERLGRSSRVPDSVCVKVSERLDGWVREAYFGQVLDGHPRAIRVYDAFALPRPDGPPVYALALEYARDGDLRAWLQRRGRGLAESTARREIAGILEVLGTLHRGEQLHRDLTPMNVFVCEGGRLKLGDFGLVVQQTSARGAVADALNPHHAPSEIVARETPKWQARDDVYQVGQLLAMLVKGDARTRVRTLEIRGLPCSDHLKEILYRCIGERRKRYETADELIQALRTPAPRLRAGVLRTLVKVHLAFTGILSVTRKEAARAARRAGAFVHGGPSAKTTVVVRGRPNPLQVAGQDGGVKLLEIKRLREEGHRITLLNEEQFWRLAGRRRR